MKLSCCHIPGVRNQDGTESRIPRTPKEKAVSREILDRLEAPLSSQEQFPYLLLFTTPWNVESFVF